MEKEFRETLAFIQAENATEKKNILLKHSDEIKRRDEEKAKIAKKHLHSMEELQEKSAAELKETIVRAATELKHEQEKSAAELK